MSADLVAIENRLWAAADQLWANTGLKPAEFSTPVLGLIFLRYADKRFGEAEQLLDTKGIPPDEREAMDYQAEGVLYLPLQARFSHLLTLTEGANLGRAIATAMELVEAHNPELQGVLPRGYNLLPNATLVELLRLLAPLDLEGDAFGKVYEYFLGNFALKEGQKGGVFYTPTSIVRLIVEILQPFHGRIFDPACGSGGMFVQSAAFVQRHQKNATRELTVFGTEKASDTVKLAKMNLAVHGLSGDVREANTYYEDPHKALGRFDFVMANPPFNVSGVDKDRLKDDPRFALGLPSTDNANYLWIQLFASSLNENGRAGFVMANSAGDARGSELEIRKKLIQSGAVDVIVSIGSNFFYTVTLPCTLWFFDRAKARGPLKDKVLFVDARPFFKQVTRAIREFAPEQLEFLANVVRLYRGEAPEFDEGSKAMLGEHFAGKTYADVAGLCKAATLAEIEAQGWSLNPGRYVGVGARAADEFDFAERLEELNEELELLNASATELQVRISEGVAGLLEAR
ncbi:MAG: N-6 DNA methylase [Immundisolibacter sp.]|uniref:type I restriction-modification system subunit M n=1 Tax=Immundisolibacter sp. TaxID=1934948 RepID=UPI00199BCF45|nr:class I SAM-dependent DNA methyltransferase [Immundisolibacter sp.]MBC7160796.1 N-6 DNA methylase [Immundisolibacter sp.]